MRSVMSRWRCGEAACRGSSRSTCAAWLGVPPILAGPASLHVQATGAGESVRALVGSLMGEVELKAPDGPVLSALPEDFASSLQQGSDGSENALEPAGLDAVFPLERGVLLIEPLQLDFGASTASLEGAVDLYLWAVDLTLRRAGDGPLLKVVGPLHRPQVRLLEAAGPEQATPAPGASP